MARTLIENVSAGSVTLPAPLRGVIPVGGAVVSSFAVSDLIGLFNIAPTEPPFVRLLEVAESTVVTAGLEDPLDFFGQSIQNIAAPINPQDAATKAYVDGAAPTTGVMVCLDNATPTTVNYETRGAVYLASAMSLAAASAAYFSRGGSSNTSYLRLTDAAEVTTYAEFITSISISAGYAVAALDPLYVGVTLAAGWYIVQVKYTSGGASYASALGLYLQPA